MFLRDNHWKFERFLYFNFEKLRKIQTFFKKLEDSFLVESTKTENATFPCKTALPEANVKTNKMWSRKWALHRT